MAPQSPPGCERARVRETEERRKSYIFFHPAAHPSQDIRQQLAPFWRDLEALAPPQVEHQVSHVCVMAHIIVGSSTKHVHRTGAYDCAVKLRFDGSRLLFQVVEEMHHLFRERGGVLPRIQGRAWAGLGIGYEALGLWCKKRSTMEHPYCNLSSAHVYFLCRNSRSLKYLQITSPRLGKVLGAHKLLFAILALVSPHRLKS